MERRRPGRWRRRRRRRPRQRRPRAFKRRAPRESTSSSHPSQRRRRSSTSTRANGKSSRSSRSSPCARRTVSPLAVDLACCVRLAPSSGARSVATPLRAAASVARNSKKPSCCSRVKSSPTLCVLVLLESSSTTVDASPSRDAPTRKSSSHHTYRRLITRTRRRCYEATAFPV